jgi:choline dehydrogenase-like flavoprotein
MVEDIYQSAGLPRIPGGDINGGHTIGFAESTSSTFNGERQWSASGYALGPNVTLWSKTVVQKLFFEGNKAVGVALIPNADGGKHVMAKKEVIICSGAQGSPKLLLLSGIGPQSELNKHGIQQLVDLPVGENYSEHPFLATFWKVRDRGLCFGDGEMITENCDWTAGIPYDYMSFQRHDGEEIATLARQTLSPAELERFQMTGRPHTESFIM